MIFFTKSATSLACYITFPNFFHIFSWEAWNSWEDFSSQAGFSYFLCQMSSLPLVMLIQDLVPIKNTCQVKEEAIAFFKLDHVRQVVVRPVYTIQRKNWNRSDKKTNGWDNLLASLSNENYEVPKVQCRAWWNASVSRNESECLCFNSHCTNLSSQSAEREKRYTCGRSN